jgi:hypothetical protein
VPLVVRGRGDGRVLVVIPTIGWQGVNQVDDEADGFANTLETARAIPLGRPFAGGVTPAGLGQQVGPLLRFLDAEGLRYDLTTDLALARDHGARLAGHAGVVLAGDEPWLTPGLAAELRGYVQSGGNVASFGGDSLRRRVSVTPTVLARATRAAEVNALGEATVPVGAPSESIAARTDSIGLFAGTDGVVGPFTVFDESAGLPRGQRALVAAGIDHARAALVAYRLGRGLVLRLGSPQWSRTLASDPDIATVTRKAWALLSR